MSTEQKRTLYGLLIFGTTVVLAATIVTVTGSTSYFENEEARRTIFTLVVVATLAWLAMMLLTRPRSSDVEVVRDERDRLVADRARRSASVATNVYLLVFCIVVVESYQETGSAPVVLFFFMAMSTIAVSQLVQSIAMLIGYRRT